MSTEKPEVQRWTEVRDQSVVVTVAMSNVSKLAKAARPLLPKDQLPRFANVCKELETQAGLLSAQSARIPTRGGIDIVSEADTAIYCDIYIQLTVILQTVGDISGKFNALIELIQEKTDGQ